MGLVIPPDPDQGIELVMFEPNDVDFIQEQVGGCFDVASSAVHGANIWFDDLGKAKQRMINHRATTILWLESIWREHDFIVGSVLVTGQPDESGSITSVPESVLDAVGGMYGWKFEVQNGTDEWVGNDGVFNNYFVAATRAIKLSQRRPSVTEIRVVQA